MQHNYESPFPFMELPPELRDMVYENLLEDPYYPPPPRCPQHSHSLFNFLMPGRQVTKVGGVVAKESNWILLANKQCYAEFMDVLVKKTTFHLTVSPENYYAPNPKELPCTPPSPTTSVPSSPTSTAAVLTTPTQRIFTVSPETLQRIRRCSLKLITTSSMLGVPNPRNMTSSSWALANQLKKELASVKNVEELNLHVKAIGDPLWNPLWVWYHASQSFKDMGTPHCSPSSEGDDAVQVEKPAGPKVNRITFSLDTWSPGENYLARSDDDEWAWYCTKDHQVSLEGGADITVRDFCTRLYMECRTCRPELESEDEDDGGDEE